MDRAQGPARGQPLIEVAYQNDNARSFFSQGEEQLLHLESALHWQKPQVGDNYPYNLAVDFQIGVDGAAWFAAAISKIQITNMANFVACEQHISEMAVGSLDRGARDRFKSGSGGRIIHLVQFVDATGI